MAQHADWPSLEGSGRVPRARFRPWRRWACDWARRSHSNCSRRARVGRDEDPWPHIDALLRGQTRPPQPTYDAESQGRTRHLAQLGGRASSAPEAALAVSRSPRPKRAAGLIPPSAPPPAPPCTAPPFTTDAEIIEKPLSDQRRSTSATRERVGSLGWNDRPRPPAGRDNRRLTPGAQSITCSVRSGPAPPTCCAC